MEIYKQSYSKKHPACFFSGLGVYTDKQALSRGTIRKWSNYSPGGTQWMFTGGR